MACLLCVALLGGCSNTPEKDARTTAPAPTARVDLANTDVVRKALYAQYSQWKGTRYEVGGLSRKGIDCSGFVYLTFRSRLGVTLPRSTESLVETGEGVGNTELRSGDLVFFKTGIFERHVGIYLEKGRFLHASTSRGVIISDLSDDYWRSTYWKARRV